MFFKLKKDCKKKIIGQRFLTHKLGEFRCKDCNSLMMDKCFVCKIVLDEKECFADDKNNSYCSTCIKIYQEEKMKEEAEKIKAEEEEKRAKKEKIPLKKTIHCDFCTQALVSDKVDFNAENFNFNYLACNACTYKFKSLTCKGCKQIGKCNFIWTFQ
jgi:hypothetical protein